MTIQSHAGYRFLLNLLGWDSLSIEGFFGRDWILQVPKNRDRAPSQAGCTSFPPPPRRRDGSAPSPASLCFAAFWPCWKNPCGRREQNIHRPAILGYQDVPGIWPTNFHGYWWCGLSDMAGICRNAHSWHQHDVENHTDLNSPKESRRRSSSGAPKTKKGLVGKANNPGNQMILLSLLASKQLHVVWKKYEKYAVRMASYKLQPHKLLSF